MCFFSFNKTNMKTAITAVMVLITGITTAQIDTVNFNHRRDYALSGLNAFEVKCADLDSDGKPDMVISIPTVGTMTVFRNQSTTGTIDSASLTNRQDIQVGGSPNYFHIADFDKDGKPDIAISGTANNSVTILRNTSVVGTISFAVAKVISLNGTNGGIAGGYLNNDSLTDLVVSSYGSTHYYVFTNTSTTSAIDFDTMVFITPNNRLTQVLMQDYNGDGKPDLLFCRDIGFDLLVYKNTTDTGANAPIAFVYQSVLTSGSTPNRGDTGDIDGDGKTDVVISNYNSRASFIHRNISTADSILFQTGVSFDTDGTEYIQSSRLHDLNNDGKPDLIQTFGINQATSHMQVYVNQAMTGDFTTTTFGTPVILPTLARPVGITFSDIDGDGTTEIVVCNFDSDKISVFGKQNVSVGLRSYATKPVLNIFPNPTHGLLKIENPESAVAQLLLTDITGRIISRISVLAHSDLSVDIQHLPAGMYYLSVLRETGDYNYKVLLCK
jgi:hypothetical protein